MNMVEAPTLKDKIAAAANSTEMRMRLTSSMLMQKPRVVGLVALEAGRRSGIPGDRVEAAEYRKLADASLTWLGEKGVL